MMIQELTQDMQKNEKVIDEQKSIFVEFQKEMFTFLVFSINLFNILAYKKLKRERIKSCKCKKDKSNLTKSRFWRKMST